MLNGTPLVYAAEEHYQIVLRTVAPCICTVHVGDTVYYDDNNGVLRSASLIHRVELPMAALDRAGGYTVCLRPVTERKPYFTQTAAPLAYPFVFRPVPQEAVRAFHISDAHDRTDEAIAAGRAFGDIDLLILNGDLANHNGHADKAEILFAIGTALTGGEIPIVFARGNHDTRGAFAERFTECIPLCGGRTYYTFRLGGLWGVVLDCGEDKDDTHEEYGHTACFHAFRERETAFLEEVARRKAYEADGIHTRLVIVHNPFTHQLNEPFQIEKAIYSRWATVLREQIRPDLMICGHLHTVDVHEVGSAFNHLGQPCTLVTAGRPADGGYTGVGFTFEHTRILMCSADSDGAVGDAVVLAERTDG